MRSNGVRLCNENIIKKFLIKKFCLNKRKKLTKKTSQNDEKLAAQKLPSGVQSLT